MREKTQSTALEMIRGSTSQTNQESVATVPQTVPHPPPKRLHATQAKIWEEVESTIALIECDLFLLETLVCLIDQQRVLQRAVNKDGPIIKQLNGRPMHNPAAIALRQLEPQLTRCFKELGMSPATRKRLKLDCRTDDEYNEWAEF